MRRLSAAGLLLVFVMATQGFGNAKDESSEHLRIPAVPSLEITGEMEVFLQAQDISPSSTDARKIEALLYGLFGSNWKDFTYVPSLTLSPAEAFNTRKGNCLSFAMLFVTLARALGMEAVFNEIDQSPSWSVEGGVVVEAGHINIMVESGGHRNIVEWDDAYKDIANLVLHPVSDERAISHYFNNLGIQALTENNLPLAKTLFEKALEIDSTNADAWQNYGVYWMRAHVPEKAEEAFLEGTKVCGKRSSLYFLLANFYKDQGDTRLSRTYLKKAERYAKNNPFYHFNKATEAKKEQDYSKAANSLRKAIKRLPEYHLFHYELAECYDNMGDRDAWQKEMELAIRYVEDPERQRIYQSELDQRSGVSTPLGPSDPQGCTTPVSSFSPDVLWLY